MGDGLQHCGAVDGAAAAFAGTGSGFCGAGAVAGTGARGALPGGRPAYRPIERLGGLAQHKARGASIYFDTAYAALVCLLLCGLGVLAFRWRVRLRVALPGILLAAAVGIGLGNALSRDVVHIDLVGNAQAPAVVVAQNDRAVVLFRGGSAAQRAVENQLARRGVRTVELVADLRMNAKTACTLPAQQGIRAERLPVNASRKLRCTPAAVELLRTREGCLVRLSIGNRQFVTLSGRAELAQPLQTEWLIATPKKPETVQYQKLLALRRYSWMAPETQYTASLSLRRTGGERLG